MTLIKIFTLNKAQPLPPFVTSPHPPPLSPPLLVKNSGSTAANVAII